MNEVKNSPDQDPLNVVEQLQRVDFDIETPNNQTVIVTLPEGESGKRDIEIRSTSNGSLRFIFNEGGVASEGGPHEAITTLLTDAYKLGQAVGAQEKQFA